MSTLSRDPLTITGRIVAAKNELPVTCECHELSTYFITQGRSRRNVSPHGVGVGEGMSVGVRVETARMPKSTTSTSVPAR